MIQGLVHSYDVYEDLLSKSQKGVEFYKKLETNVTRLHERTVRLCKQQEEERQMVTQKHKARRKTEENLFLNTLHLIDVIHASKKSKHEISQNSR